MIKKRLSKLMSERGIASRREADRLIEAGKVFVDGIAISELGYKCDDRVKIELSSEAQSAQKNLITLVLNKPLGYLSNLPCDGYPEAKELLTPENQVGGPPLDASSLEKLGVLGRLDINSKGLLLFSQDGRLAKQILSPATEKEYLVVVEGQITGEKLRYLRDGLYLDGERLRPARVTKLKPNLLKFVLNQGKKRQIRRMCELVELDAISLYRTRIGDIMLSDLPKGKWRII